MLHQHNTLVAEAIVAAEVGRMMGDASDLRPTLTAGDLIKKYRLNWGTYHQGKKERSVAAQYLRDALRWHPLLTVTGERRDKYIVYTLLEHHDDTPHS
jgi:hypothetical protein